MNSQSALRRGARDDRDAERRRGRAAGRPGTITSGNALRRIRRGREIRGGPHERTTAGVRVSSGRYDPRYVDMLRGAYMNLYDVAVLVTGDGDYIPVALGAS